MTLTTSEPTSHTPTLIKYAQKGLQQIYRKGHLYSQAGVMLMDITPVSALQMTMGTLRVRVTRDKLLMAVFDKVRSQWGKGSLSWAAEGFKSTWQMRSEKKSRNFTTRWDELAVANVG